VYKRLGPGFVRGFRPETGCFPLTNMDWEGGAGRAVLGVRHVDEEGARCGTADSYRRMA
jgi:hypothetical protein